MAAASKYVSDVIVYFSLLAKFGSRGQTLDLYEPTSSRERSGIADHVAC